MNFYKESIVLIEEICSDMCNEFGNINNGGCGVFAKIMDEIFKTNSFLYVFEKDSLDQDPPIHIYLKLKRGKFLDANGFSTKKNIYENYGYSCLIFEENADILNAHYDELGEGLFVTDYKDKYENMKEYILENLKY